MNLKPVLEAIIYVTEEPVTLEQAEKALAQMAPEPPARDEIRAAIEALISEYQTDTHGIEIREVAGGYKMATKPEHHEAVRQFVKSLKAPIKLSLAALETLAVIAYRQPVTVPEIQEVRGVNAAGVIKTLLDKKLVMTAGRKEVMGRPVLYKTTKEFLVQFGLKDLSELPTLKEFEELSKAAMLDTEAPAEPEGAANSEPSGDEDEAVEASETAAAGVAGRGDAAAEERSEASVEALAEPAAAERGREERAERDPAPEAGQEPHQPGAADERSETAG